MVSRASLTLLTVVGVAACTDQITVSDTTGAGSSTSATTNAGSSSAVEDTTASSTQGVSDSSGSGSTGDPAGSTTDAFDPSKCWPFNDTVGLDARDIVVTNTTDEPLVVAAAQECVQEYLSIELAGAGEPGVLPNPDGCNQTCDDNFEGVCGCGLSCVTSFPIMIAPGASLTLPWDGGLYSDEEIPPIGCFPSGFITCDGGCHVVRYAKGTYLVSVRWATTASLTIPRCACTPDADGLCTIEQAGCLPDAPFTVQTVFDHPSAEPIELQL